MPRITLLTSGGTLLLLLAAYCCAAQPLQDTLGEVQVRGRKKRVHSADEKLTVFSPGQKVVPLDSLTLRLYRQQSLAQLLYQQAPVFIKSYGFNGLATLNFRGSSAAQAQVLWNGVPLQNAALGIADVSLLPVAAVDRVNVVFGGSAALWGSGNVGGVVLLENDRPAFDSAGKYRLQASAGAGSFGQYQGGLKIGYSGRRWQLGVNAFGQRAVNDFSYKDLYGAERNMPHSRLAGGGVILHGAFRAGVKDELRFSGWHQQYDRQIPPALFETVSAKEQQDQSTRLLLAWEHREQRTVWYAKSAWIQDDMHYEDPLVLLTSANRSYQYFQEAGMRKQLPRGGNLTVFMPVQHAWMQQPGGVRRAQTRAALASALQQKLFRQRLSAAASLRAEMIGRTGILLPGANAAFTATDWLELRANVQRTYRAPTLNEWYYTPGGNDRLRPERGWAEEAGYTLHLRRSGRLQISHDATVFNRDIKDWILWLGGAIWTPHNIAVVGSRGAEAAYRLTWRTGRWQWHHNVQASFIQAATRSSYLANDGSIGRQIPYTPRWQWQANAGFSIGNLYANYNHTYSGYRYITTDESQLIPSFHTGNIQLLYTFAAKAHTIQLTFQCNNISDKRYEVVAGRPMPGRNWLGGMSLLLVR